MLGFKTCLSSQAADFFDTCIQNVFPDITGTSVWVVTALRSSSSVYTFFCIIIFFSLLVLLTAHKKLLSE
jgi:hypothetical protein